MKRRSEEGKLPFQIYLVDDKVIGFGIEEPDHVGLSRARKNACLLVPISLSHESLREFVRMSLKKAKERGLGYVYATIDADRRGIIPSLVEGGIEIFDEYFWMSRSLEEIKYKTKPTIDFDQVTKDNFQLFTQDIL